MIYKLNQRVLTPHGEGEIVGFERFNSKGFTDMPSTEDDGENRIIVKLDHPEKWSGSATSGYPHYWHRDIQEAN